MHPMRPKKDFEPSMGKTPSRNVKIKTVLAETLAVEYPSAGEWTGYSQQIRYAIAPHKLILMSVRPQAGHDNNPAVPARQVSI